MKDSTRKALCEMRLLAVRELYVTSRGYVKDIYDLESDDVKDALKNLHMAASLLLLFENYEKKLAENDNFNRVYTQKLRGIREAILIEWYSCNMGITETFAWKELIDSFKDSHHAGDEKL